MSNALRETASLIWPAPARVRQVHGRAPREDRGAVLREFVLVPHARRPRLALPVGAPRAAADVVRKYSQGLTSTEYLTRSVLGALLGSRPVHALVRALLRDRLQVVVEGTVEGDVVDGPVGDEPVASLEAHVSSVLDTEVLLGLSVGPSRANQKPVLQAVTPDGRTPAYVKLGIDPLTRELVRGEAEALAAYWNAPGDEEARSVRAPRVLHHGTWRGLEVLVLEAVRPRRAGLTGLLAHRRRRTTEPVAAMAELAGRPGTVRARLCGDGAAPESPMAKAAHRFWERIAETPAALHDAEQAAAFAAAVDAVKARYGDAEPVFGAWHGDWTPWNMVWDGDQVLLWDFERFALGVPVGADLAHYRLQSVLRDGGQAAAEALLARPGWAAGPSVEGVPDAGAVNDPEVVAAAYLLELARRWALIAQLPAGGPLRERTAWLLTRLRSVVSPP